MINEKILKDTFAKIRQDIERQDSELEELKKVNKELLKEIRTVRAKGSTKLEKEVMKKFNRSKKDIIKHKILEVVKTRQVTIPELKEIIVDQEEYCSKASFYRYLEEIKDLINLKNNRVVTFSRI
jgi:hypothetical protein